MGRGTEEMMSLCIIICKLLIVI